MLQGPNIQGSQGPGGGELIRHCQGKKCIDRKLVLGASKICFGGGPGPKSRCRPQTKKGAKKSKAKKHPWSRGHWGTNRSKNEKVGQDRVKEEKKGNRSSATQRT